MPLYRIRNLYNLLKMQIQLLLLDQVGNCLFFQMSRQLCLESINKLPIRRAHTFHYIEVYRQNVQLFDDWMCETVKVVEALMVVIVKLIDWELI